MDSLYSAIYLAGSGMNVQGERMKVVAQNVANAESTGRTPGADPYRRKTITFKEEMDKELGLEKVGVDKVSEDRKSDFKTVYNPSHPAANAEGYVKMPNVNMMMEMMDMREAQRSYNANLNVIDVSKNMMFNTINLLK